MGKNIRRGDGDVVSVVFAVFDDSQGKQSNIIAFLQLFGQIAGAVGQNLNIHFIAPLSLCILAFYESDGKIIAYKTFFVNEELGGAC